MFFIRISPGRSVRLSADCQNLLQPDGQCGTEGRLRPSGYLCRERDGDPVVECEDDKGGVAVEEKVKIFDTGFGNNTGLSLALSREILDITGITIIETG